MVLHVRSITIGLHLSHLGWKGLWLLGVSQNMSRDSMVTSIKSGQWSCESLERGILEAAKMAGIEVTAAQLGQAWGWMGI